MVSDAPSDAALRQKAIYETPSRGVDLVLLCAIIALIVVGTVAIFSSSAVYALKKHDDSFYFLKRHLVWMTLGTGALWVGATMDYRLLKRYAYPLLLLALALLVVVLLFGARINAARRWIALGPLSFQPTEFAKLALVTFLAYSLSKKAENVRSFTVGFVPHILVCAIMIVLLLKQPDLGSAIILASTTLVLLFVAGTKVSYIAVAVLMALPMGYHMIVGTPWRMQRFMAFFNPDAYSQGVAYQIVQSKIAIGSGGLTGAGLGQGRQQLGYMPEGHNDFIMSGIGEELGYMGFALVLCLFMIILWRGVRAAIGASDRFGTYLAFGITTLFAFQALINTGVVLGALPAKGLTLPLVSYGGTSLLMSMFLMGILLGIARRRPEPERRSALTNHLGAHRKKQKAIIVCG